MRHAMETAKFQAADANHDQLLDKAEMASLFFPETSSAVLDVVAQHTMKAKDKDKDGSLSFKEFMETDEDEIDVEGDDEREKMLEEDKKDFKRLDKDGASMRFFKSVFWLREWAVELARAAGMGEWRLPDRGCDVAAH